MNNYLRYTLLRFSQISLKTNLNFSSRFEKKACLRVISNQFFSSRSSFCYNFQRNCSNQSIKDEIHKKSKFRKIGIGLGLGGVLVLVGAYVYSASNTLIIEEKKKSRIKGTLCEEWELTDHTGQVRSSKDFRGSWTMVYCGFTHCPDVCPDELDKMVEAIELIEGDKDGESVIPIFITLDPKRDTVPAIAKYVQEFSPKMIGFTGTPEQIAKTARSYYVYFSEGAKDDEGDYIVDHSIIIYLINPDGEFVDYYGLKPTATEIASSVILHMHKFRDTKALVKQ